MVIWGWIGVTYGVLMAMIAVLGYARRPFTAIVASILYALAAAKFATVHSVAALVTLPAAMTLVGYWLSGLFVGTPQPWLESSLLDSDRRLFRRLAVDRRLLAAPTWVLDTIEFVYSTVYLVVMAGALVMAPSGAESLQHYWSLVLPAELLCCAALPFLRSRPPRSLEAPGVIARRSPRMRRFNEMLVNRGSIQVNTIPSAHVAAALAAGLAVVTWLPVAGGLLIVSAALIGAAATLGRYHYALDCLLGAGVATTVWIMVAAFS